MEDIMKIVKSVEESWLLIQGISETIKYETKKKKGGFLSMLLGTLAASILGNTLTEKEIIRAAEGTMRAVENFEIQKYYQNESKFNDLYSKNNLWKISICNKSWWVWINRNSLDCFVCKC